MPIFFGIVVQMYWRDHSPPHIHAYYQSNEALIAIEDGRVIAGRMPPPGLRLMREWIGKNRDALMANWERGRQRREMSAAGELKQAAAAE